MRKLFGTDGIRGPADQFPLDPSTMFALGESLAHRLSSPGRRPRIIAGMDTRESSSRIVSAIAAGVEAGGGDVVFGGVMPTPAVAWLCRRHGADAGLSISASHNPWPDNGVKIFGSDGMKLADAMELSIETEMLATRRESHAAPNDPPEEMCELLSQYEDFLLAGIGELTLSGRTIVLDSGNGAASGIARSVFERAGATVVSIHDQPDGRNINDGCGALHPEVVASRVCRENAAFGVAFDGDADRAIFVDDEGRVRNGDEILYLWGTDLHDCGELVGETIVATVMSNFGLEKALEERGIRMLRASVGDKYVFELMRSSGSVLGGEQSGHIIDLRRHTTGDGLHTALATAEIVRRSGTRLSRLKTFHPMPQMLLNLRVSSKPPLDTIEAYVAELERWSSVIEGRGRILVRYSGTENLVRVMVEGEDAEETRAACEALRDVLASRIGSDLP